MIITLGLGSDGHKPHRTHSALGKKEMGPLGFLALLETQCGIAPIAESPTTRIIQYQACLAACNTPKQFYYRSFAVDPFNVAKTLLQWRDTWYEGEWSGQFKKKVSPRLQAMAAVETLAKSKVSFGFGQRLQRVLVALQQQHTQINEVILLDPLTDFSSLWQHILVLFTLTEVPALSPASTDPDNDLKRVQQTLAQLSAETLSKTESGIIQKTRLTGDGSVVVVKARSKAISARLLSQWLAQQAPHNKNKTIALLSDSAGVELDDALAAVDLPRLGFSKTSPCRPPLQVLPMALDLLWEPLNPEVLLQCLMHPVGVLPGRIRYPLAKVVAATPGIGGEQWHKTLTELLEKEPLRKYFSTERFKQLKSDLEDWFSSALHTPEAGLSITVALQRIQKVVLWLAKQQVNIDDDALLALFSAASSQANELNMALSHLSQEGLETIAPEQLRYLLEQLTGAGTAIVDQYAECIPNQQQWLVGATRAESVYQPVDTVIWWDLQANGAAFTNPWSSKERQELKAQGVFLPDPAIQLQQQAVNNLKPIYAAKERLVLVLHASDSGHHPLWDQFCSCLENWQEISAESGVLDMAPIKVFNNLSTQPVAYQPLETVSRWWTLSSGDTLAKREQESYSSLESFIYSPYQWVLHYKARLMVGTLQSLSDGKVLKGNLVHRLYQHFFNENPALLTEEKYDQKRINEWFDKAMPCLLTEEGAVLLQPGRLIEKEQFIATARKSLLELIRQLHAANIVKVDMELKQDALFFGGKLCSFIDMNVTNAEGLEAVIDIKWGGSRYRKASLKAHTHLQLVTYAYVRRENKTPKKWSAVAYFIIDGSALLAQNADYFPEALVIQPDTEDNLAVIWQKVKKTWDWRRAQLDKGRIEVTVSGTQADANSDPGEEALSLPETSDGFNDYRVLTGWRI